MKPKIQLNSCGFGSENLDDWLECDLRQSGILPSKNNQDTQDDINIKIEELDDWEIQRFCDNGSDDKTVVADSEMDRAKKKTVDKGASSSSSSTQQLAPIIRAFFTTLQQQQQQQRQPGIMLPLLLPRLSSSTSSSLSLSTTPDSINPLHISKTLCNPPLGNSSATATSTTITSTPAEIMTTEKPRGVEHPPDGKNVMDPLILKRLKNTHAARRSRQRKVMKMERLQARVAELEKRNEQLRSRVAMVEKERDAAKISEKSLRDSVAILEAQLAEAQQSLIVKQETLNIGKS